MGSALTRSGNSPIVNEDEIRERVLTFWTRVFTVAAAFAMAFCFRIDALDLVNQLLISSEARSRLLQAADSIFKRAEETLAPTGEKRALASLALHKTTADPAIRALPEAEILKEVPDNLLTRLAGDD
jgi:hypothetical protein